MMECTVHRGMTGVTLGKEVFTDLDFADDVSLRAEMLEVLCSRTDSYTGRGFYLWSSDKLVENQNPTGSLPPLAQQSMWQMDMLKWSMHLFIWDA